MSLVCGFIALAWLLPMTGSSRSHRAVPPISELWLTGRFPSKDVSGCWADAEVWKFAAEDKGRRVGNLGASKTDSFITVSSASSCCSSSSLPGPSRCVLAQQPKDSLSERQARNMSCMLCEGWAVLDPATSKFPQMSERLRFKLSFSTSV